MTYSRRQLYALGETLGSSVTSKKAGGGYVLGGGGGGGGAGIAPAPVQPNSNPTGPGPLTQGGGFLGRSSNGGQQQGQARFAAQSAYSLKPTQTGGFGLSNILQKMGLVNGPVQNGGLFGGGGANGPQQAQQPTQTGVFGLSNLLQQMGLGPQAAPQQIYSGPGLGPQAAPQQIYGGLLGGGGAGPAYAQPMGFLGGGGGANGPQQSNMFGGSTSNAPQAPSPVNPVSFSGGAGQGGQQQQGGISSNPYYSAFLAGPQQQGGQQNPGGISSNPYYSAFLAGPQQQGGMFGGGAGPAYAGTFSGNNNAPSMPRPPSLFAKGGSVNSAQGLASLGRGDDKMLVHMTPGEVRGLQSLAMAHGGSLTINPHTGLPEAGFLSSILPMALGVGLTAATGLPAWQIGLGVGGATALASGDLRKGLQVGMGAYGGAGLGNALAGFGQAGSDSILANSPALGMEQAAQQQIAQQAAQQAAQQTAQQVAATGANLAGLVPGADTAVQDLATSQYQMPGMQPPIEAPSRFDQMLSGAQKAYDKPMDFLGTKGVPTALASAAAPLVSNTLSGMIQPQGLQGLVPQTTSAPNYPNYSFQQTRNPNWGQPGEPYYIQNYVKMAGGGAIGSMPELRSSYPGSRVNAPIYATLPSTDSQETIDGYGPKIDPFTGEQGMAKGGIASGNLADFKMYPDENETSGVEDLTPTQLEAAADSDDPYLMGAASLERDRRKGSGTKGYRRKEFAHGGIATLPEYAAGGKLLRGPGDGMSDDIPAVIKGPKPQRAALADGEFVVPADVVSHLGNGSTEAGAKRLYSMMDKVRHARTGNKKQGRQINAERFLPA